MLRRPSARPVTARSAPCSYLQTKQYTEAIALINTLLRELKRLDDKMMLVEVHLLESRIYLELRNIAKSRVRRGAPFGRGGALRSC